MVIERNSPVPLYIQVADLIRERIASEFYEPGELLPKEALLAESFDVSRITIRSALEILSNEGLVVKKQGKGTFITDDKKTLSIDSVQGFYSLLVKSGADVETVLLKSESRIPENSISTELGISEPETVRKIKRLYLVKQKPIAIITTHLFKDVVLTNEESEELTVYGILSEKLSQEPVQAQYQITATQAAEDDSEVLMVPVGSPLLILQRTSFNIDGTPIEYTDHLIVPEDCNLEFVLKKERHLEDLRIFNSKNKEFK